MKKLFLSVIAVAAVFLTPGQKANAHWVVYRRVYVYHHVYSHRHYWHHGYWSGGYWHPGYWYAF
jgi:hypothetical protein